MGKSAQSESSLKTLDQETGRSLLSRPSVKNGKNEPKLTPFKTFGFQNEQMAGSLKTTEDGSQKLTSFKTLADKVKKLNPRYIVPVHEASQVISDPHTAKTAQQVKSQPSNCPLPKELRLNPIYMEPGSTTIDSTRDL